ncbi:unnamed protein product, partial [Linum tenue]
MYRDYEIVSLIAIRASRIVWVFYVPLEPPPRYVRLFYQVMDRTTFTNFHISIYRDKSQW